MQLRCMAECCGWLSVGGEGLLLSSWLKTRQRGCDTDSVQGFLIDINSMPHYTVTLHALHYLGFSFAIKCYM